MTEGLQRLLAGPAKNRWGPATTWGDPRTESV